jgi:hypothetical protein
MLLLLRRLKLMNNTRMQDEGEVVEEEAVETPFDTWVSWELLISHNIHKTCPRKILMKFM